MTGGDPGMATSDGGTGGKRLSRRGPTSRADRLVGARAQSRVAQD